MTKNYQIEALTPEQAGHWDELIVPYESRQLFHGRAWLDYLAASRRLAIRLWTIRDERQTVGYFCGGLLRKGPFSILGSPLKGWGTNAMGPVISRQVDQFHLLGAVDRLAKQEHIALIEIENPILSPRTMTAAHYQAVPSRTYVVSLRPESPDAMWRTLSSVCRNRIRKAIKAGLTVEHGSDLTIGNDFYDLYSGLMSRQGLLPSYSREAPCELVRHLGSVDGLFALRVRDAAGKVLAIGLFPHDSLTMYFWGGASRPEAHKYCPNEYLHWTAMLLAARRGLSAYNMCGEGQFKKKFGGELVHTIRWHKSYYPSARLARRCYAIYFERRLRAHAWLNRAFHRGSI